MPKAADAAGADSARSSVGSSSGVATDELRDTLGALMRSESWSDPVTKRGPDGAKFDLDRAEVLLAAVEQSPVVRAAHGSGAHGQRGAELVHTLESFMGELEVKFVDGRPTAERPRAKAIQARIEDQLKRVSSTDPSPLPLVPASSAEPPAGRPARPRRCCASCRCDIWIVLTLIGWQGIDMSVTLPSLWLYIQSLGGSKTTYGTAGAVANAVGFVAAPLFGWLSDRVSSKGIIVFSLVLQGLGGLVYSSAALFPHPAAGSASSGGELGPGDYTGPYLVIVARFLIGLASGSGATARAYLTRQSDAADKTANLGMAAVSWRIGLVVGPVINVGIVHLPNGTLFGLVFTNLTWVGYFIFVSSVVYIVLVMLLLRDESAAGAGGGGKGALARQSVSMGAVGSQLYRSNAWVMQYIGFTNNFALAILQYFLPVYCLEQYGYGQVDTANIFSVYGAVAAATSFTAAKLSPRFCECSNGRLGL